MSISTGTPTSPTQLADDVAGEVRDLISINIDSVKGFRTSAQELDNPTVASLFRELADQRQGFADELKRHVSYEDAHAAEGGSWTGKAHRWWIDIKSKLGGGTHAILAEAERGEDSIKAEYEKVIKRTTGSPINDVLHEQLRHVKAGHDRVRDLRDSTA